MLRLAFRSNLRLATASAKTTGAVKTTTAAARITGQYCPPGTRLVSRLKSTWNYDEMYKQSIENPTEFWGAQANDLLTWEHPFETVNREDLHSGMVSWFTGGKLNATVNAVERHVATKGDQAALLYEKNDFGESEVITYKDLLANVCRLANALKKCGVGKGDTVVLYMPMTPHAVYAMLACARIGAPHAVVFAGFSSNALRSRIQNANAKVVITADEGCRGNKRIPLKATVVDAIKGCPSVEHVLVQSRTGADVPKTKFDHSLEEAMAEQRPYCPAEVMDSEDPLFHLYTSGSTGTPKGLTHTHGGYLTYAALSHKHIFDYQPGDVYACVADVGWVTGHTYVVYGPLVNGATTVIFESLPTFPDAGRYWEMVERLKVNQFYTAPTAIRALLKEGDEHVKKYDLSSLRVLGTVGEPINPEAWQWYHDVVGNSNCTIVDTWWQTETGGVVLTPLPGDKNCKPGYAMKPFYGVEPALFDDEKNEVEGNGVQGLLGLKRSIPGIARTVIGNHQRFLDVYYTDIPGAYFSGDGAERDGDGDYKITGRVDDVINVSGHRLGTKEIEDAVQHDPHVAAAAVIGYPHEMKGEGVYAFVIMKDGVDTSKHDEIVKEIQFEVSEQIGKFAKPDYVLVCDNLPKTNSGKVARRILRKIAAGKYDDVGDLSPIAEPQVVYDLISGHKSMIGAQNT